MSRQYDHRGRDQINVETVKGNLHVGDRTNFQQQVTVVWSESIAPKYNNSRSLDDSDGLKRWVDQAEPQAELLKRIDGERWLIEIVADSGFGKSLLAAWLYDEVGSRFGRSLWVGFSKVQAFDQFARWVLQEIGYLVDQQKTDEELLSQLVLRLTENRCLLVMDQLEAVWNKKTVDPLEALRHEKNAALFERFLQAWQKDGRKSVVLVTTQQELAESYDRLLLTGFSVNEGITFLTQQQITEHTEDGLGQLVQIADGHPLLLNLAASWLKQDAKGEITAASLGFFERLFRNYEGDRAAQVDEIFAALFTALPERLRSLLLNMVVYRDALGLEMAQAILPDASIADLQTLEERAFLRSLSSEKWTLHPLMLRSVQQALRDSGQEREAHQKAIAYFAATIRAEKETIADCAEELEIFHHLCELGEYALAYQIMDTCVNLLNRRGYYRSLLPIYDRLTHEWNTKVPTKTTEWKALSITWTRLGDIYWILAKYQEAIDCHLTSLEIQRRIGDRDGEGGSLCNLGLIYDSLSRYHEAVNYYQESLEIIHEGGNRHFESTTLGNLGNTYRSLAQHQKAIELQQKSLGIKREIGDRNGEGGSLCDLGLTYKALGRYQEAIELYQQSLKVIREVGNRRFESNVLGNLGDVYDSLEQYKLAIEFYYQSLKIQREIGYRSGEASSLGGLGNAYNSLGEHQQAIELHEQSLEIEREIGNRDGEGGSLCNLGNSYESLGQYQRAIELYGEALIVQREVGNRESEANSLFGKSLALEKYKARRFEVINVLQQAREIYTELQLNHMIEQCDQAIHNFNQSIKSRDRRIKNCLWFGVGVAIVLLIAWLRAK